VNLNNLHGSNNAKKSNFQKIKKVNSAKKGLLLGPWGRKGVKGVLTERRVRRRRKRARWKLARDSGTVLRCQCVRIQLGGE